MCSSPQGKGDEQKAIYVKQIRREAFLKNQLLTDRAFQKEKQPCAAHLNACQPRGGKGDEQS